MRTRSQSSASPLDPRDWILLALQHARRNALTAVQLQKDLFLLGSKRPRDVGRSFYTFTPYHYGPFCADIYSDAEALMAEGWLEIDGSAGRSLREYRLTPEGLAEAERLKASASSDALAYLDRVVPWSQDLSFAQLVRAIYDAFPEMRENSAFRDADET